MRGLAPTAQDRIVARGPTPSTATHRQARIMRPAWLLGLLPLVAILATGAADRVAGPSLETAGTYLAGIRAELSQWALTKSAEAGYALSAVDIEGAVRTAQPDLMKALALDMGAPLLAMDLEAARDRISALPWVAKATLERRPPGLLRVVVVERIPMILWQNAGVHRVLDSHGRIIAGARSEDFPTLPKLVGAGAPEALAEFQRLHAILGQLAVSLEAAVRVSTRRWRLHLTGGPTIELPERDPIGALRRLAGPDRVLLERALSAIDLRLPDRIILRLAPGADLVPKAPVPGADA